MMKVLTVFAVVAATVFILPAGVSAEEMQDRVIVRFRTGVSSDDQQRVLDRAGARERRSYRVLRAQSATVSYSGRAALLSEEAVEGVDPDLEVSAFLTVGQPRAAGHRERAVASSTQELTWNLTRIGAPVAWNVGRGAGARVAVLDTGAQLTHPDLVGRIAASRNFVRPGRSADDDNGHGTHVAGVIAATDNSVGIVGVAPDASLLIAKVLDSRGRGYVSDIIAGLDWAVQNNARVVNMSLGLSTDVPSLRLAVERTVGAGISVVAAAGNDGGQVNYPAAYPAVIAVGATDATDTVPSWSAQGQALDLVAPGVNVKSTYRRSRYVTMTGTSMATPHVAAAVALLSQQPAQCDSDGNGVCVPAEIEARLRATATDLLASGYDVRSGAGRLNVAQALGR